MLEKGQQTSNEFVPLPRPNRDEHLALIKACEDMMSFIAVMVSHGPDAKIPETVAGPMGLPIKVGVIMRNGRLALEAARRFG